MGRPVANSSICPLAVRLRSPLFKLRKAISRGAPGRHDRRSVPLGAGPMAWDRAGSAWRSPVVSKAILAVTASACPRASRPVAARRRSSLRSWAFSNPSMSSFACQLSPAAASYVALSCAMFNRAPRPPKGSRVMPSPRPIWPDRRNRSGQRSAVSSNCPFSSIASAFSANCVSDNRPSGQLRPSARRPAFCPKNAWNSGWNSGRRSPPRSALKIWPPPVSSGSAASSTVPDRRGRPSELSAICAMKSDSGASPCTCSRRAGAPGMPATCEISPPAASRRSRFRLRTRVALENDPVNRNASSRSCRMMSSVPSPSPSSSRNAPVRDRVAGSPITASDSSIRSARSAPTLTETGSSGRAKV